MKHITSYRHMGIVVKDMEIAMKFYCDLLEHEIIVDFTEEGAYFNNLIGLENASARVVKANSPDGTYVELIEFKNIKPIDRQEERRYDFYGLNHICFKVEKIHDLYEKLVSAGIEFISEPLKSDFDPVYTCFCYDYEGNLVQFVEIFDYDSINEGLR